ncbi:MAG: tetratricopeptide repeat protein [Lutibacter sp.]|uniref:tetratricopeptide repeat protein n=1 Tax=Lutibacter sp. TaxID=1925666 RepID=UPI00299DF1A2|nr:tetratricopeptide repeat protein [Lutibacter sp.]MDX1830201.1 tetratricopeptide repeat protein [Lutibacter sp.]
MATYKKTGSKSKKGNNSVGNKSTTAEVFNTLDETATKSEKWVKKNEKMLFILLALVVVFILGTIGYQKYIKGPQEKEAADELAFPKAYFQKAITNDVAADSLYTLGLNGADGKYGFIDVAKKYSGTKAGNLADYYAGISYYKLKKYDKAIDYLEKFTSDDEVLGPIAKGAMGDIFSDINQPEDALTYYLKAANLKDNNFSTPLYLFKAGNTAMDLHKYSKALDAFNRIKKDYPNSDEARNIDIYISKATYASKK